MDSSLFGGSLGLSSPTTSTTTASTGSIPAPAASSGGGWMSWMGTIMTIGDKPKGSDVAGIDSTALLQSVASTKNAQKANPALYIAVGLGAVTLIVVIIVALKYKK